MLTFTVYGVAQSKGSTRAFVPRGMKHPIVTDTNRNAKSWQQLVAAEASRALNTQSSPTLVTGAIALGVRFYLPRPQRFARRGVAAVHTKKPDLDKLLRAVLDALTGVVFADDAQVHHVEAIKQYADVDEVPHAVITVDGHPGAWRHAEVTP